MLEDVVEGVLGGASLGVGLAAAALIAVIGAPRARPLAKSAVRGYLSAAHRVRESIAEATESVQDIYAEAKHEYEAELQEEMTEAGEPEAPAPTRRRRRAMGEQPA